MKNSKIIGSTLAALWFTFFSILAPITAHAATYSAASNLTGRQWYVPAQGTGVAGAPIVATAATMLGRANPWIAAITLGTPIMQYLLQTNQGQNVAIAAKNALQPTPSGWTDSNTPPSVVQSGAGTSSPALTGSYYAPADRWQNANGGSFTTPQAACTALRPGTAPSYYSGSKMDGDCSMSGQSYGSFNGVCSVGLKEPLGCWTSGFHCDAGSVLQGSLCVTAGSCPSGYALSGGTCALTDPSKVKWPSDGTATLVSDGQQMFSSPLDPDPLPAGVTITAIQNGTQLTGIDPYGNYQFTQITPQSGGGFNVTQAVQLTAPTPTAPTTTTFNSLTVNNLGNVTNTSTKTVIGDIINITNSGTPTTPLPDDYNREVTQKAIETELKAATAPAMPDQAQRLTDAAQANKVLSDGIEEKIKTGQGIDKSMWFSWVWTPPVGSCSPSNKNVHGIELSLDYCGPVDLIRDIVGWLFALFGAINIYGQLFRRES